MIEKFPGTDRQSSIDSTIEDMALWDERERIAKGLYQVAQRKALPGTFWSWGELNERTRKPWLEKAYAEMQAARGVQPSCEWVESDPWGPEPQTYDSACGEKWSFIDGGVKENGVKFCHNCGKPVAVIAFPQPADEEANAGVPVGSPQQSRKE